MKTSAFALAVLAMTLGPSAAQSIVAIATIELDCSAYQRQNDGSWEVLKPNKIVQKGILLREVIPGDDLEAAKLTDGSSLRGTLDSWCARLHR